MNLRTDVPARGPHRLAALLLWVLAMAVGLWVVARAQYSADMSAFLPASPLPQQQVLIDQLNQGSAARTLLVGIEGGSAAARADASRALAQALRTSGHFEQVHNGDTAAQGGDGWRATGEWLLAHRYQLSAAVTPQRFTADGLRAGIDDSLALLGTPAGAAVKAVLERDPTGELQGLIEALLPAAAPRIEQGVWVSRRHPRAVLLLGLRASGSDLDGQAAALDALHAAAAPLRAQGLRLQVSGPPVFAVGSRAQIEREAKHLAVAGTVVMGGLLLLAFASWQALLLAFVPVATGAVCGVAAVSLVFGQVHGITLAFGSTLIGESVDYAIYYLIQARRARGDGTGWRTWLAQGWPTVRLGLLTSVCGFAALVFSGFPGLSQLGVFSIAGLLGASAVTRWLLPRLMPDGAGPSALRQRLGALARWGVDRLPALRWPVVLGGLAVAAALVWQHGRLWQGDLASLSPVPRADLALYQELQQDLAATDGGLLVVAQGADPQAALQAAERAGARLDDLVTNGVLAGYDSPARVLPSVAMQAQRLAALPSRAVLAARLQAATAGGPLPARTLAPFLDDVDAARSQAPVTRESLQGLALAPMVDALLFRGRAAASTSAEATPPWFAVLALHPGSDQASPALAPAVRQALQGLPQVWAIDVKAELDALYAHYLAEARWQAGLGALAVVALLALTLRSGRRLLAICQPLVLAVLFSLGLLALLRVPLGILHLVGMLLVVAVGSNYALFFDQADRTQEHRTLDDDTLASLLLANLTTVASFGLIALSPIPALSALGEVVAPGALLALLFSAAFARRPAWAASSVPSGSA